MGVFRRLLYQISDRVYVFPCSDYCYDDLDDGAYETYIGSCAAMLRNNYPDASFTVFNFEEGELKSQISNVFRKYNIPVLHYPGQYKNSPVMPLGMLYNFLHLLSLEGKQNVMLMHCKREGWPMLAFMLASLLLYRKQINGEQETLEKMYRKAPIDLIRLISPLNHQPSQMRYLQYMFGRELEIDWPPSETPLVLDCIVLKSPPRFRAGRGCMPVARVYGHNSVIKSCRSTKPNSKSHEKDLVKLDILCRVQGDVVLECVCLSDLREEIMFRVMFHTAFVRSNKLLLSRDEVDIMWHAKDQFPREFKAEVHFLDVDDAVVDSTISSDEEFYDVEETFSNLVDKTEGMREDNEHLDAKSAPPPSPPPPAQGRVPPPPPPGQAPQPPLPPSGSLNFTPTSTSTTITWRSSSPTPTTTTSTTWLSSSDASITTYTTWSSSPTRSSTTSTTWRLSSTSTTTTTTT